MPRRARTRSFPALPPQSAVPVGLFPSVLYPFLRASKNGYFALGSAEAEVISGGISRLVREEFHFGMDLPLLHATCQCLPSADGDAYSAPRFEKGK